MLIDLLYKKNNPEQLQPYEEYILAKVLDSINEHRQKRKLKRKKLYDKTTRKSINIYRQLDSDGTWTRIQFARCQDLLRSIIWYAWRDAMSNGESEDAHEARVWWLRSDNDTRKWMLDAVGIAKLEPQLRRLVREHVKIISK